MFSGLIVYASHELIVETEESGGRFHVITHLLYLDKPGYCNYISYRRIFGVWNDCSSDFLMSASAVLYLHGFYFTIRNKIILAIPCISLKCDVSVLWYNSLVRVMIWMEESFTRFHFLPIWFLIIFGFFIVFRLTLCLLWLRNNRLWLQHWLSSTTLKSTPWSKILKKWRFNQCGSTRQIIALSIQPF